MTRADLTRAFRTMARITHPDKGGDPERFKAVTEAYDAARRIVARGDDVAGTRASEPRERYDWRRGRSSFETRGQSAGARGGEPNRCDDAGVSGDAAGHRAATRRTDRGDANDADAISWPSSACSSACSSSEDEDDEGDEDDGASERANPTKPDVRAPVAVLSPRAAPDGRKRPAVSVACSPDGVVAAACLEAGVHVWDAAKGALLAEHVLAGAAEGEGESPPEAEAPTGDGAASDGNETKKQKTKTPRASDAWWALDGRSLLVAYDEGSVLFWGHLLRDASVTSSCPSSGVLFRREKNSREKQSAPTPKPETLDVSSPLSLRGHHRRVVASAWFVDPNKDAADVLVTASLDSTARVWRFSKEVEVVQGLESSARTDETDETDASAAPKTKTKTKTKRRLLSCTILPGDDSRVEGAGVTCCAVTADGAFLAAGDSDGVFSVWAFSQAAPFATLAQRVRWAGRDASSRVDDAVLKCAFVDVPGNDVSGSRARSRFSAERECDGYRLVTAHYSRDADQSRLLVWRVGRRKNVSLKKKNAETLLHRKRPNERGREASGDENAAEKRAACFFLGASVDTENDTSTHPTFTARTDRAFRDHREIRGYEQCVPAGGRVWRGRVADVTFSADYASPGGARTLVACGAAGWVTVIEVADAGGSVSNDPFQTMYTAQNPRNVGARRARLVAPSIRSGDIGANVASRERQRAEGRALVAVAGEDGVVVARDAEDGEEVARFAVGECRAYSRVWSLSGFASRRDGTQFLVAGTADGDVACWKVPDHLFSFS